jgi:hypothetical protein
MLIEKSEKNEKSENIIPPMPAESRQEVYLLGKILIVGLEL